MNWLRRLRVRLVLDLRSVVDVLSPERGDDAFVVPLDPERERVLWRGLTEIQRSTRDNLINFYDSRPAAARLAGLRPGRRH